LKEKKEGGKKNRARNAERSFFFLLPPHFIHLRLEAQVPD
jgi:hypothetical protein